MMIGKAKCSNGLYVTQTDKLLPIFAASTYPISVNSWRRLRHLSSQCLSTMKNILHICSLAKQRQLSFPLNNNVAFAIFDLVHSDI